jgi:hypothetical protein
MIPVDITAFGAVLMTFLNRQTLQEFTIPAVGDCEMSLFLYRIGTFV